jgi:hypothetical protein
MASIPKGYLPQTVEKPWAPPKPACFLKKARPKTFIETA